MERSCDVLVIGGGICGLSVAVHAARRGLRTTLVEMGEIGGASTQRSGALLRAHYPDRGSAALAKQGIEHFADFERRYGGPAGYRETGFAYIPMPEELSSGALEARLSSLIDLGIETWMIDAEALRRIDPELDIADVGVAAYEPRAGYADPGQVTKTLAAAAVRAGAELISKAQALRLIQVPNGGVLGAELEKGSAFFAASTVLCNGAWSVPLAATVGLELPIRPTAVRLVRFDRTAPSHLTVIDAPGGIYFRANGSGGTLVGQRAWTDTPLSCPDAKLPPSDKAFAAEVREPLIRRIPRARAALRAGGHAGVLDMTPDGLPLVGPSTVEGLWLCCGWSGTGFKTAPAVGELLSGWLAGEVAPVELAAFDPQREPGATGAPRSPH